MNSHPLSLIAISLISVVVPGCSKSASPPPTQAEHETRSRSEATQLGPKEQPETSPGSVSYTVVEETVSDKPIKTQIEQHVLAARIPTTTQLETELLRRYQAALTRGGFRYYNLATNIYIYIYGSQEQARARQGLWIGMIARGPLDKSDPRPVVDQGRLSALSSKPEERFGLSEDERKAAFREIVAAEDRATDEAMAEIPDTDIMKQIALERELQARYKRAVARKYRVTDDQLTGIGIEGVKKGWPQ